MLAMMGLALASVVLTIAHGSWLVGEAVAGELHKVGVRMNIQAVDISLYRRLQGDNKLEARGVKLAPGAKAVAALRTPAKKTITVRFTPKALGSRTATLSVSTNAAEVVTRTWSMVLEVAWRRLSGLGSQGTSITQGLVSDLSGAGIDSAEVAGPGFINVRLNPAFLAKELNLRLADERLGVPALVIPCGFDSRGLPLSVQLVGRPFAEATLLAAGHAFQRETDWHQRIPA